MIKLISIFFLFLTNISLAEKNYKLVNEILFETSVQPVSSYDYQNFKSVYNDPTLLGLNNKLFKSAEEEFLFIYLVSIEAEDIGIDSDPIVIKKLSQKIDSSRLSKQKNKDTQQWVQKLSFAANHLKLKKAQHESRDALAAWYESLQRKFNLQVKSNEFKNKIQFK